VSIANGGGVVVTGPAIAVADVPTLPASKVPAADAITGAGESLLFSKAGANLNSTADQALTAIGTIPAKYQVTKIVVTNASVSLGALLTAGGIYTAASKGGIAVVAATQLYTSLTGATLILELTIAAAGQAALTAALLYFALTTAAGSAATADIYVFGRPLP
jgi:hypothetical protein